MARKVSDDEKKRKRVSLAVSSQMYHDITTLAKIAGASVNEYCCGIIAQDIKKKSAAIESIAAAQKSYDDAVQKARADFFNEGGDVS